VEGDISVDTRFKQSWEKVDGVVAKFLKISRLEDAVGAVASIRRVTRALIRISAIHPHILWRIGWVVVVEIAESRGGKGSVTITISCVSIASTTASIGICEDVRKGVVGRTIRIAAQSSGETDVAAYRAINRATWTRVPSYIPLTSDCDYDWSSFVAWFYFSKV